jgi:AAA15 family ATPase/GTPase
VACVGLFAVRFAHTCAAAARRLGTARKHAAATIPLAGKKNILLVIIIIIFLYLAATIKNKAMIQEIYFEHYKPFQKEQKLKLAPITILMGKNSAGKSAILRLILMHIKSLKAAEFNPIEPLLFQSHNYDFASNIADLFYKKEIGSKALSLGLSLQNEDNYQLLKTQIRVISEEFGSVSAPRISNCHFENNNTSIDLELFPLNISNHFYQGTYDKKNVSNIFLNLSNNKIKISDEDKNLIFEEQLLLPEVRYMPPLRPDIKRFYHTFFDKNTAAADLRNNEELSENVASWYKENMAILDLKVHKHMGTDFYSINNDKINLIDIGQGIGQSLPIVVDALKNRTNTLNIIEQPELHLHPAAHGALAQLFADSAKANPESKFLIETHSENLILRLRRLRAEGLLTQSDLAIYWVEYNEAEMASHLHEIIIDENGDVDFWPDGVFSEDFEELKAIGRAQNKPK